MPRVFDRYGEERDWGWLVENFGPVEIWAAPDGEGTALWLDEVWEQGDIPKARIEQVRRWPPGGRPAVTEDGVRYGTPRCTVHVEDAQGEALGGVLVARRWPHRETNLALDEVPEALRTWFGRGVVARTSEHGDVFFEAGPGDAYAPPELGASTVWLEGRSDAFYGWGWLAGTRFTSLRLVFRQRGAGQEEPAPPADDGAVLALLNEAVGDAARAQRNITKALALLGGTGRTLEGDGDRDWIVPLGVGAVPLSWEEEDIPAD